jgi:hypothetical protein
MDIILLVLAHPVFEVTIHLMIGSLFIMELLQHWSHHRKGKNQRSEKLYTLDEARIELFGEALKHGNKLCTCASVRPEIWRESVRLSQDS